MGKNSYPRRKIYRKRHKIKSDGEQIHSRQAYCAYIYRGCFFCVCVSSWIYRISFFLSLTVEQKICARKEGLLEKK